MPQEPQKTATRFVIATRESPLALWQAEHVATLLSGLDSTIASSLLGMTTQGDQMLSVSLSKVGGKGLFVKELEKALMDGRADIAVHSGKDVPMQLPRGMKLIIVDRREDPFDALVLSSAHASAQGAPAQKTISSAEEFMALLPENPVIGTSSLRRQAQLKHVLGGRDFTIKDLRGNLNTRLAKLDAGEYDAIVLASAGLHRLGMTDRISARLLPEFMLPAVAQGALTIEYPQDKAASVEPVLERLKDRATAITVSAERALNRSLEGSCQVPIAAFAQIDKNDKGAEEISLHALVASIDGQQVLRENGSCSLPVDQSAAEIVATALGEKIASQLLARGAKKLVEQARDA